MAWFGDGADRTALEKRQMRRTHERDMKRNGHSLSVCEWSRMNDSVRPSIHHYFMNEIEMISLY